MSDQIQYAVLVDGSDHKLIFKPLSPCTATLSSVIQAQLKNNSELQITDIYFDMSASRQVDSTFSGFLATLATGRGHPSRPKIHLVNLSNEVDEALSRMHLMQLFDVIGEVPGGPHQLCELSTDPADAHQLADLIIESHESLIKADERNIPRAAPVVDAFKAEKRKLKEPPE